MPVLAPEQMQKLLDAVEYVESRGNPRALSPKGARGLMQIMPATARQYGVNPADLYDPGINRALGARILSDHLNKYPNISDALVAYNAGPGRVGRPPRESRDYIKKIVSFLGPSSASAAEGPPMPDNGGDVSMLKKPETIEALKKLPPDRAMAVVQDYLTQNSKLPQDRIKAVAGDFMRTYGMPMPGVEPSATSVMGEARPSPGAKMAGAIPGKAQLAGMAGYAFPATAAPIAGEAIGSAFGPLGTVVGGLAGAALGGAIAPQVQRHVVSAMTGQPFNPASTYEQAKGALINTIAVGAGYGVRSLMESRQAGYADAAEEMGQLPRQQRTMKTLRGIRTKYEIESTQQVRNADFWRNLGRGMGMDDQQSDAFVQDVMRLPKTLQDQLARDNANVSAIKETWVNIQRTTAEGLHARYKDVLGPLDDQPVDTSQVAKVMSAAAQDERMSPRFRTYLQEQANELSGGGYEQGLISQVKAGRSTPAVNARFTALHKQWQTANPEQAMQPETLNAIAREALGGGSAAQTTVNDLRNLRTSISQRAPRSMTGVDQAAFQQVNAAIDDANSTAMLSKGATPEQIGAVKALDQEWGKFRNTMRSINPMGETFPQEAADAMWDPMEKSPGTATRFITYAKAADELSPGTWDRVRQQWLTRAIEMAKSDPTKGAMGESANLTKLVNTYGGPAGLRTVTREMFGEGNYLANPDNFLKLVSAAGNPNAIAAKISQSGGRNLMSMPFMQRMLAYSAISGVVMGGAAAGGLYGMMTGREGRGAQVALITAMLFAGPAINYVAFSGNGPLQSAAVKFATSPNVTTMSEYATRLVGSIGGSIATAPSAQEFAADPYAPGAQIKAR